MIILTSKEPVSYALRKVVTALLPDQLACWLGDVDLRDAAEEPGQLHLVLTHARIRDAVRALVDLRCEHNLRVGCFHYIGVEAGRQVAGSPFDLFPALHRRYPLPFEVGELLEALQRDRPQPGVILARSWEYFKFMHRIEVGVAPWPEVRGLLEHAVDHLRRDAVPASSSLASVRDCAGLVQWDQGGALTRDELGSIRNLRVEDFVERRSEALGKVDALLRAVEVLQ